MMKENVIETPVKNMYLTRWEPEQGTMRYLNKKGEVCEGPTVKLLYEDGNILRVSKPDFDRAFGCIISCTFEQIATDFAIMPIDR